MLGKYVNADVHSIGNCKASRQSGEIVVEFPTSAGDEKNRISPWTQDTAQKTKKMLSAKSMCQLLRPTIEWRDLHIMGPAIFMSFDAAAEIN